MEFLKIDRGCIFTLLLAYGFLLPTVLFDCSEFNQPVVPEVPFSRDAYDYDSSAGILFYYHNQYVTLWMNRILGSEVYWRNATLFMKFRTTKEYMTKNLSDTSFDLHIDIYTDPKWSSPENIWISFCTIDSTGDTLHRGSDPLKENGAIDVGLGINLPKISLFYWQIEFYNRIDTLRLPEKPGIWYFGLADEK